MMWQTIYMKQQHISPNAVVEKLEYREMLILQTKRPTLG